MAKARKYRTKADAAFARRDDIRLAREREEREKKNEKERERRDALPMFSVCRIPRSSGWFWAVWKKAADFTGTQSVPANYGIADSERAALQAAEDAAGPNASRSNPSAAGPTYQYLKRIGKI